MKYVYIVLQESQAFYNDENRTTILRTYDHRDDAVLYVHDLEIASEHWAGTQWFKIERCEIRERK